MSRSVAGPCLCPRRAPPRPRDLERGPRAGPLAAPRPPRRPGGRAGGGGLDFAPGSRAGWGDWKGKTVKQGPRKFGLVLRLCLHASGAELIVASRTSRGGGQSEKKKKNLKLSPSAPRLKCKSGDRLAPAPPPSPAPDFYPKDSICISCQGGGGGEAGGVGPGRLLAP